jgi:hypothetical protein
LALERDFVEYRLESCRIRKKKSRGAGNRPMVGDDSSGLFQTTFLSIFDSTDPTSFSIEIKLAENLPSKSKITAE